MEKLIGKLTTTVENVKSQLAENNKELSQLEEDFANVKLNPYGITSIDFSKRQELSQDVLKMEGTIMGLELAMEMAKEMEEVKDGSNQ